MKKWVWKEAAEVLGVLGVIASLIFVALEIQQNTNAVRSATINAIADLSYQTGVNATNNPELRAALRACRNGQMLTEDQRELVLINYTGLMRLQQNRFLQLQLGVLDEDTIFQMGGRGPGYRNSCFRDFWTENAKAFPLEFQQFIEREILPLSESEGNH